MRRLLSLCVLWMAACTTPAPEVPRPPPCQCGQGVAAPAVAVSARTEADGQVPVETEAQKPRMVLRDAAPKEAETWATEEPEAAGFDRSALEALVTRAKSSESSSLLILHDGKLVTELYFGHSTAPIETMSVTKSIVSLAIGLLVKDGKITTLDVPLSKFIPEFGKGKKAKITLRQLLTQTSGLAHGQGAGEMNKSKDRLAYAIAREVASEPGSEFSYNNEATQLLSKVIATAAGQRADEYVAERIFKPLGIKDWRWVRDGSGNVQTFYGLALNARDLAKIGMLLLNEGRAEGQQLLTPEWVKESTNATKPGHFYGYLWWIRFRQGTLSVTESALQSLAAAGFKATAALRPLIGRTFTATPEREDFWLEAGSLLDASARTALVETSRRGVQPYSVSMGQPWAFAADGWLGQQLIVIPSRKLVIVRQHRAPQGTMTDDAYNKRVGYFRLINDIESALVAAKP